MTRLHANTALLHPRYRCSRRVEGAPERSFWTGLKLGERQVLPVLTYRCAHCGYLESYARATAASEPSAGSAL